MKRIILTICVLGVLVIGTTWGQNGYLEHMIKQRDDVISLLAKTVMEQSHDSEEKTRALWDSGIVEMRMTYGGTKPYFNPHFAGRGVAAIHDHSNHFGTLGMGEVTAVLNGVQFTTRHNDYMMKMPVSYNKTYHEVEDVPYPDVPPEVLNKRTHYEQILEMREWFKAFKTQNASHRDYRQYFKPVLCYLEGAWTVPGDGIDEPFFSDRHAFEDSTWDDLLKTNRFNAHTGTKSRFENSAYLPRKIYDIVNNRPVMGQWNYRIACHPLESDLPTSKFRLVDDLAPSIARDYDPEDIFYNRIARFALHDYRHSYDTFEDYGLLDKLMGEVPGKDNYGHFQPDMVFGATALSGDEANKNLLDSSRFHRSYFNVRKGAGGEKRRLRGFNDRNLFMAQNTQDKILPARYKYCRTNKNTGRKNCHEVLQKMSYAFPLEIVYLTPLHRWNPFDIAYYGSDNSVEGEAVTANGRNGKQNENEAFNGTNSRNFYRTPVMLFGYQQRRSGEKNAADTSKKARGVLDRSGRVQLVTPSGIPIILPNIPGVGPVRIRYPIMPFAGDGNPIYKEMKALQEVVASIQLQCCRSSTPSGDPSNPVNEQMEEEEYDPHMAGGLS